MSNDYIVVDWVANKFYTLMENTKNVKLNDLVTCHLNDTKDNGVVIFVGSEKECKQLLIQLKREQNRNGKQFESNETKSKDFTTDLNSNENHVNTVLDENIIYENDEMDDDLINELNNFNTANHLTVETFQQQHDESQQQLQHTDTENDVCESVNKNKKDNKLLKSDNFSTLSSPTKRKRSAGTPQKRLKRRNSNKSSANEKNPCNNCNCCRLYQKQLNCLNEKLSYLESSIAIPSEVLQWFEHIKSIKTNGKYTCTVKDESDLENIIKKIPMDTAKLQQCTVLYSATATARNIVRVLVPEKKLLAGMYLEDLEKSFGIESVNAIIDYCHVKFGEPKEIIKNSISNVMSKARQYLKTKSHEEIQENVNNCKQDQQTI